MAEQYGVMQGVADLFGKGGKKEEKPAPTKDDTSWHNKMVSDANDSFRKTTTQKVGGGTPPSPTKKNVKVTTRKRLSRKT